MDLEKGRIVMEKKKLLKISSIVLVPALLISTLFPAFAASANPSADNSTDKWITKASMKDPRRDFRTEVINGKIYAIGGHINKGSQTSASVEEYDPASNQWTQKSAMLNDRADFSTEVVNGKIYAMGGYDKMDQKLVSVEEYDPAVDKWVSKKSMHTPRFFFQTEVIDGKIYALGGGDNDGKASNTVEEYDPLTDTWTAKASMHYARIHFQTEVIDGKIYAIGGLSSTGQTDTMEEYDPLTDTWTEKASMLTSRQMFQTENINGKIFAIGGYYNPYTHTSHVEMYDPSLNMWVAKKSMSTPRCKFQTATCNGKIFAIAGSSKEGIQASSEEYDPANDTWVATASLSDGRDDFQTATVDGKIFAIGGEGSDKDLNSVEEYISAQSPTLTVTPAADDVTIGSDFTTTVAIHKGTNICAEDIKLTYDTDLFEYESAEAKTGLKIMKEDSTTVPGTIRFILSSLGKDNAATGDKDLLTLKFKAKKPGQGKVKITNGRIADNATLEMDVAADNCGEATITVESNKDVNRSGDVTLLDLGIDGWYYGMDAKDTDSTKYDADVMPNGKIDDDDLSEITRGILSNSKYPNN